MIHLPLSYSTLIKLGCVSSIAVGVVTRIYQANIRRNLLETVKKDGITLKYASESLRNDLDFITSTFEHALKLI